MHIANTHLLLFGYSIVGTKPSHCRSAFHFDLTRKCFQIMLLRLQRNTKTRDALHRVVLVALANIVSAGGNISEALQRWLHWGYFTPETESSIKCQLKLLAVGDFLGGTISLAVSLAHYLSFLLRAGRLN